MQANKQKPNLIVFRYSKSNLLPTLCLPYIKITNKAFIYLKVEKRTVIKTDVKSREPKW